MQVHHYDKLEKHLKMHHILFLNRKDQDWQTAQSQI